MREVLQVALRSTAFVALWLAFPDSGGPASEDGGAGLWLLALIALVALLWGVVDGLLSPAAMTRTMLRWAVTAPVVAVLTALGGGLADGAWLPPVDLLRWVAGLTAMLYFVLVLPAGLGVVAGSGMQGLGRSADRRPAGRR